LEAKTTQPVIVIVTFGSSMEEGRRNLEDFDRMVRERFPDHDIRWAWTAGSIIRKLARFGITTMFERQVPIQRLDEVYEDLRQEGKTDVVVQCLLIMPGFKMRQALGYRTDGLNVKFGYSLFFDPKNVQRTADALSTEFGDADTAVILCAHGNDEHPEYNAPFVEMDAYLRQRYDNVFVAAVEGPPDADSVIEAVKQSDASRVKFVPLMLVEGDHVLHDVMGDEPDSWKELVGLPATNVTGLASNPRVMEFFLQNIADLLSQFQAETPGQMMERTQTSAFIGSMEGELS
jgi:sirohydrochlorin cobaltochelatase